MMTLAGGSWLKLEEPGKLRSRMKVLIAVSACIRTCECVYVTKETARKTEVHETIAESRFRDVSVSSRQCLAQYKEHPVQSCRVKVLVAELASLRTNGAKRDMHAGMYPPPHVT